MTKEATPDEVLTLARNAGLDLPEPYAGEIVAAYGHLQRLLARLPRDLPMAAEPAHVFRPTRFAEE